MKRILAVACSLILMGSLVACNISGEKASSMEKPAVSDPIEAESSEQTDTDRQIQITTGDGNAIVFALNGSTAASNLYAQLPLSVAVENYGSNEKIFYPPKKLDASDAPLAKGSAGMLTYYAPWGDVAIYYGDFGGASGLYELGEAVSGAEYISDLTDEIKIEAVGLLPDSSEALDSEINTATSRQSQYSMVSETTSSESRSVIHQTSPPQESQTPSSEPTSNTTSEENAVTKMKVRVGGNTFTATLESNSAVDSFTEMMNGAPIVISMNDYSGFEKVGALGTSLPTSNSQTTAQAGDIVLYNGNQIVILYGSNSWRYTRIGKIDNLSGWADALGSGDVTVTFSIT